MLNPINHNPDVDVIVKRYDAESNFRSLKGLTAKITVVLCVLLSLFHVYTAGFGLLNEVMHRTVHLSFVLGLVFLVFPRRTPVRMGRAWGFGICFALFHYLATLSMVHLEAKRLGLKGLSREQIPPIVPS